MNNQFDELTKQMAQLVTRRGALKKFGLGLVGMALALGIANKGHAQDGCLTSGYVCTQNSDCCSGHCKAVWVNSLFSKHRVRFWVCT